AGGVRAARPAPGSAAWLYALGVRAAADRAELARARRDDEEALEARQTGDAPAAGVHARPSPQGTAGTGPPPGGLAVLGGAELARLDGRSAPQLGEAAAKAWERLGEPYPIAYARWRQ